MRHEQNKVSLNNKQITTPERWKTLMNVLGFESNIETYNKLITGYSEKHRHYHSLQHLKYILLSFDESKQLAEHPHEVELALWFHDAIYKIFAKDNEQASAEWAKEFLQTQQASDSLIANVYKHIMATLHNAECSDNDSALVVDIDLAILGVSAEVYEKFEQNVRKEYRLIPSFIYRKKRKEILQFFLDRKNIYHHEFFRKKYENQARTNLETALINLNK